MNKNIILTELIRKLPEVEDVFYEMKDDRLHVFIKNNGGFDVRQSGGITTYENTVFDDKFHEVENIVYKDVTAIREYVSAYEKAPDLIVPDLSERYKKLAEFNKCVLAAKEVDEGRGFEFVTWNYENDSLYYGHYYGNNYSGAKEDFATRSGLMNEDKVFTNDELFSISRCLEDTLNGGYELDYDEQETLKDLFERIKNVIPDYKERCITLDEQDNQEMNNSEFDMSM